MMNKLKTRITEKWYGFKAESLLQNISFFELLAVIKENKEKVRTAEADCNEDWIYIYEDKSNKFTLYYKLLRVTIQNSQDSIIQVSVLKPGCHWEFDSKCVDISNTFDIYTWYNVESLIGDFHHGEKYLKGKWNEYVYNTASQLNDKINSWTRYNVFNDAFKNNG
jgi:hypothetical protein